jgi:hypothetical protein
MSTVRRDDLPYSLAENPYNLDSFCVPYLPLITLAPQLIYVIVCES